MTMKMKKENENHRLFLLVLLAASVIMLIAPVYATDVCDLATGQTVYTGQVITCDSVREFYWCTDSVGHNGISTGTASTTWTDFPYPTNPTAWRYHTRLDGGFAVKNWWYWAEGPYPTSTNVTFSISDSTNFATKLMGVNIAISGGQTGTTNVSGIAVIKITPNSSSTLTYSLTKTGYATQTNMPLGGYGLTGGTLYTTMTQQSNTSVRVNLDVRDSVSLNLLTDTIVGIRNQSSGTWRNSTMAGGQGYFDATGASFEYPLSVGQQIQLAATKTGYVGDNVTFTIPFAGPPYYLSTLHLTSNNYIPPGGNWMLVATVKRCLDTAPLPGASVRVRTGMSPQYDRTQTTDVNGVTTFTNVTASTAAMIDISGVWYQPKTDAITIIGNISHKTYCLDLNGAVPGNLTNPQQTPQPTATVKDPNTASPYPVPTDANGKPITDAAGKGYAAFGVLIDAVYAIMQIVVGLVLIWLMWMCVYLMTGGKIIDKMMKRGRR